MAKIMIDRSQAAKPRNVAFVRWGLVLVAALMLATPAAAAVNATRSIEFYEDAREKLESGKVRAAIIQLKNALQQNPDNADARFLLGTIYLRVGDGPSSEKELHAALSRGFDEARIVVPLGRAYLLQRKYQEVLDEIQSGARGDEIEADILIVRGSAHIGGNKIEDAEKAFKEAEGRRPNYAPAKYGLARISMARRDLVKAEEYVDSALALAPEMSQALILKGEIRRFQRDTEGALTYFDRVIEMNPDTLVARLGRAAALIDLNRDDDARAEIQAVRKRAPRHAIAAYLSALIFAKKLDFAEAEAALFEGGPALDEHLPSQYLRGVVAYARGQLEQTIAYLGRYVEFAPNHLFARKILAAALIRMREGAKAAALLQVALNDEKTDDPQLLALMGNALMQDRRFSEASEYFEKAAAAAPESANARTRLALGRLASGEPEEAVQTLEAALEKDPLATRPGLLLALTHLRGGKFDEALVALQNLETRLPDNPLPHNLRGAALIGKGDIKGARASFRRALEIRPDFFPAVNNLARLDLREGKVEDAKARLQAVLKNNKDHVEAMTAIADIAIKERRLGDAAGWLEKARDTEPRALNARLRLVDVYIGLKRPEKATAEARELVNLAPNNGRFLDAQARAQFAAGNTSAAVANYREIVRLSPNSSEARRRLAASQAAAGDIEEARKSYKLAISIDPRAHSAYRGLVGLELANGRGDRALDVAHTYVSEQPKSRAAIALLGDVKFQLKKYADAAKSFESAMSLGGSGEVAIKLFNARTKAGDGQAAIAGLEAWTRAHPTDRVTRVILGGAYINVRRYDAAIAEYEWLHKNGRDAVVLNNLAWLYHRKNDPRALEFAEQALELAPDSGAVLDTVGWILVERGDAERAVPILEKAKGMLPQSPDVIYHYSVALHKTGRSEAARPFLRNLIMLYGEFDSALAARKLYEEITGGR